MTDTFDTDVSQRLHALKVDDLEDDASGMLLDDSSSIASSDTLA